MSVYVCTNYSKSNTSLRNEGVCDTKDIGMRYSTMQWLNCTSSISLKEKFVMILGRTCSQAEVDQRKHRAHNSRFLMSASIFQIAEGGSAFHVSRVPRLFLM